MINLYKELKADFKEIEPMEFYRNVFPVGELDKKDKYTKGKYVGIACEFTDKKKSNGNQLVYRYNVTDDLDSIRELLKSKYFTIISPIGYIGKQRRTENARVMYAFAIEIDDIKINSSGRPDGYYDLVHQMRKKLLPMANYIVASGHGVHLYYLFDKPLVLYPNVIKSLARFKRYITPQFWNRYITTSYRQEKMQFESAFQGFRLVGGVTKDGDRTKVFEVLKERVSIDYLNSFVLGDKAYENKIDTSYHNDLSLEQAKEKYPDWYENRIVQGKAKGSWTCKRDLYDWWLRQIKDGAKVGHRYYCLMMLSIYAIKSGISYEELEKDCFSLLKPFDEMSDSEVNRFTKKDVVDALQCYNDKNLVTYPINSISKLSGIRIEKNKRNYRKQNMHLKGARAIQEINNPDWRLGNGRPLGSGSKKDLIHKWQQDHPQGRKIDCERDLGVSRHTVLKWWNA